MLAYHFNLALRSLRRTPVLSALMIGAIALGIGVFVSMLTVYRLMSGNPLAERNDVLYAVTLDSWDPNKPWDEKHPELAPPELAYRDALALLESDVPARKVAMRKAAFVVEPALGAAPDAKPIMVVGRLTKRDFYAMFAVPFQYGCGWDAQADADLQQVVVLSRETNERVFGGQDSVGQSVRLDGRPFEVIGVLDDWAPTPKVYDLNNGTFDEVEALFLPFHLGVALELQTAGNTNCWRSQKIESLADFLASDCVWIQFWAELADPQQAALFQAFVDNYVREQKELGRFPRPLNNRLYHPDAWLAANDAVPDDNRVLVGLAFMFLGVCLLNTVGLLLAKFLGAAASVGLRRALGASRRRVFQQHLVEAGVLGLAGGVLGLGVAALGLLGVRHLYENYDSLTRLDITTGLVALGIAVASGVIAGLYPTWRVCSISPAAHLKTQ